jgi:protein-disulfide isomerase
MPHWIHVLAALAPALAIGANVCPTIREDQKAALCRYVQRKYRIPDSVRISIGGVTDVNGTCYQKIHFVSSRSNFDVNLFLTPDRKFLVQDLIDFAVDPIAEEKRQQSVRRRDLEKDDGRPSLGPPDAPVTIVVFSDFQCPYCSRFAETFKQVSSQEKRVQFVFRNLPLDMHAWAKPAAVAAGCVQMQDKTAFWRVHDYLFEHQREIDLSNLRPKLMNFVTSIRNVRSEQLRDCMDRQSSLPRIEKDLALASENKVHGTPTIFVNGQPATGGALTREYLLTLIRENLRDIASTSGAASSKLNH